MNLLSTVIDTVAGILSANAQKKFALHKPPVLQKGTFDRADAPKDGCFTVGFGKCPVMPACKIPGKTTFYVGGYRINHPATGVLDPMMAKAVYIDDNTGRGGVVICQIDSVGVFRPDVMEIRNRLPDFCAQTGCRSINICSTHDHAGIDTMGLWGPLPRSGRNKAQIEKMYEGAVLAIQKAYAARRDGDLYYGFTEIDRELFRDSRLPEVFSNKLHRVRFVPKDGGREIFFVNFSSHSESLLGKNTLISADFPAYIAAEVEKEAGADMVYTVGAIGGLIMMRPMDENNILSTKKTGAYLGKALCAIQNEKKLEPTVNLLRQEFYIPCDNHVLLGASKIHIIPVDAYATGEGLLNQSLLTEMTYMEIGSLKMLLIPGEPFPENVYGGYLSAEESADGKDPAINPRPICEIAGEELMILGLANDEIGYMPPPNDFHLDKELPYINQHTDRFDRRHYEETNSLGPNTARRIAEVFEDMMRTIRAEK